MLRDSYPRYPYGLNPPQEILDKVREWDSCAKEIVQVENRLAILRGRKKQLDHDLAVFRASIAPISLLPSELLCQILVEVVDGDYADVLPLSLVCRTWRRTVITTPQMWTTIQITLVNDMYHMTNQHQMIQVVLDRNKSLLLDVSIDFTSINPLEGYIGSCMEDGLRRFSESAEISEWLASVDWQSMPMVNEMRDFHRRVFDTLVGDNHEHMTRWRSLQLYLPWEQGDYNVVLPILEDLFAQPTPQLAELEISGHPLFLEEEVLSPASIPQFTALQHLRCTTQLDLSRLDISNNTLKTLDCVDTTVYRNLQQIHQFQGLNTLSYKVYPVMEPPRGIEEILLPNLQKLRIAGSPHRRVLDIFSVPNLSLLSVTFQKEFYIRGVVPRSKIFSIPQEVIWRSDDSSPITEEALYSLLQQCISATKITVEQDWKDSLVEVLDMNRTLDPDVLPFLRTIDGCNKFGKKIGESIDVSVKTITGSEHLVIPKIYTSSPLIHVSEGSPTDIAETERANSPMDI